MATKQLKTLIQAAQYKLSSAAFLGFSVSWKATPPDREVLRTLFIRLANRRALFSKGVQLNGHHVAESVLKMRDAITDAKLNISEDKTTQELLQAMLQACLTFTDTLPDKNDLNAVFYVVREPEECAVFSGNLVEMRHLIGKCVGELAKAYNIDLDSNLARIVDQPVEPITPRIFRSEESDSIHEKAPNKER